MFVNEAIHQGGKAQEIFDAWNTCLKKKKEQGM
jgi:hypothetical protein